MTAGRTAIYAGTTAQQQSTIRFTCTGANPLPVRLRMPASILARNARCHQITRMLLAVTVETSGFNAKTAQRLTGVTYRQLDYWDSSGLVRPSVRSAQGKGSRRVYSFADVVELRVVTRMLDSGIGLPAVRKAVRYLKEHFKDVTRPLAQLTLIAEGKRILCKTETRHVIDATAGGQVVIAVSVAAIVKELEGNVVDMATPVGVEFTARGTKYQAILTPDLESGGFTVEVPELPGVITQAETIAEAKRRVREAASLYLDAEVDRRVAR